MISEPIPMPHSVSSSSELSLPGSLFPLFPEPEVLLDELLLTPFVEPELGGDVNWLAFFCDGVGWSLVSAPLPACVPAAAAAAGPGADGVGAAGACAAAVSILDERGIAAPANFSTHGEGE